jgi:hypothetical protein
MLPPNRSAVLGAPVVIWKYRSRGRRRGGRPGIAVETRQLIQEMARANFFWGAPRIHGELLKLGINVSQLPSHAACRSRMDASGSRHGAHAYGSGSPSAVGRNSLKRELTLERFALDRAGSIRRVALIRSSSSTNGIFAICSIPTNNITTNFIRTYRWTRTRRSGVTPRG